MTLEDVIEILEEIKEFIGPMCSYDPIYMKALEIAIKTLKGM